MVPCMKHGRMGCADCFYLDLDDSCGPCSCWRNSETGFLEACSHHEPQFMERMREIEAVRATEGEDAPK